ncbi:MAG: thioredoxin family protein [Christensenellaceae bacterium]|jgi:small redox-active disulfide protein 2|nr:thioredoxin family protein [Christensenellaceae bacterium]
MALFGKKKEAEKSYRGDVSAESIKQAAQGAGAMIKVLGSGCKKCNELEANTKAALAQLGMDTTIDHVTDFAAIAAYGVMTTPALVLEKKVVSAGKVLKTDEVIELIKKQGGQ